MTEAVRELTLALFHAWRRLLTTATRALARMWTCVHRAGVRWASSWRTACAYQTHTESVWADDDPGRLMVAATFGLRAFIASLLVSVGIALGAGTRVWAPLVVAASQLLWAGARAAIVLLLVPAGTPRSKVFIALTAGLAPYALGVTPLLQFVALWPSALLTARGLRGAGVAPTRALTATRWAFGGQAVAVIGGLAVRSLVALLGGV